MTLAHLTAAVYDTASISIPTLIDGLRGTLTPEACDQRLLNWSQKILARAHIELRVDHQGQAPAAETFVVMSNHQSLYDIPVMFQALRRRVRMVTKAELFKIPGWGPAMRMAGFVEVDRGDRAQAIRSLESAQHALAGGTNIWIAPEGTRGPGDHLLPFKKGGFHLASATGARILPVSIDGTARVLSAHGRHVTEGVTVHVRVHEPVNVNRYPAEAREQLMADVRKAILSGLPHVAQ
jgi:1-acyl-sn-glycerol-3-phosphate acyltransferase